MMRLSSPGSGPPDDRTLNVEVDLLAEWKAKKALARTRTSGAFWRMAAPLAAAVVLLPPLVQWHSSAGRRATLSARQAGLAHSKRIALESQVQAGKAAMDLQTLRRELATDCRTFFDEVAVVLNSASPAMALRTLRSDVAAAEIKIRCQADADSAATAHRFVEPAGRGNNVRSSMLSAIRLNSTLGPHGVSFEYIKSIEVGK